MSATQGSCVGSASSPGIPASADWAVCGADCSRAGGAFLGVWTGEALTLVTALARFVGFCADGCTEGEVELAPSLLLGENMAVCRRKLAGRGTGDSLGLFAGRAASVATGVANGVATDVRVFGELFAAGRLASFDCAMYLCNGLASGAPMAECSICDVGVVAAAAERMASTPDVKVDAGFAGGPTAKLYAELYSTGRIGAAICWLTCGNELVLLR